MAGEKESFEELLSRIGKGLDTRTVFGEPEMLDGSAIIPVAKISFGGGGGFGGGTGTKGAEVTAEEAEAGGGEGMGGGFGAKAEPLGVIQVKDEGVRWIPIVDVSRLAAIWAAVSGFLLIMVVGRLLKRR